MKVITIRKGQIVRITRIKTVIKVIVERKNYTPSHGGSVVSKRGGHGRR